MSQTSSLIETLKKYLKARGITYRMLAEEMGLSEASVKRLFSKHGFSLQRRLPARPAACPTTRRAADCGGTDALRGTDGRSSVKPNSPADSLGTSPAGKNPQGRLATPRQESLV